jgi:hypothetical protein
VFSQGFSNSIMEIKVALVFWKLKHHCPNTFYCKISQNSTMVKNIAPWYHGAIWAFREHCISYVQVRESSDVRRLFVWLAGAVGRQSALQKENSGFAAPTLGRHISTFRGYRILFSIRNPYINRFTNHFSIHSHGGA